MKGSTWFSIIFIAFLLFPTPISSQRISHQNSQEAAMGRKGVETVEVAGSSLPDCSHACASCSPCRLVMISFVCASLQEAETCPMAYRCMCNNKSYPLP
ncbi:protein EPIDERMAL PATTERNING FACTOR 1 [Cucurbita moschata]|uniref:Epidermal patterning factor-like protein n=1 Tax=Cucurbita moschata TaxID=3662 RepID=A0A6J1GMI9_CUCMO|nr:protein EPIDERMAL PATTERNING FACTOR 1 [Cucurbita moschata]